uniref:Importin subunit alpha-4-like isoform X2 n=1 Tax=Cicer arietinum TaxID=3827 RepID=A0A3Q7X3A5_CICAR|nr:importin subunit alpha-4-like isoform X2 [Cicer arietinum]
MEEDGDTPSSPSPPCIINTIQHIRILTQSLSSDDPASQLEATTEICKLLSKGQIALIDQAIREGIVPQLVRFLERNDIPQLQSKAACILTNITSGTSESEHTRTVIKHGAVPLLVNLLYRGNYDMKEQALRVLGNIAGDSQSTRDDVLSHGALLPLFGLLWNPTIVKPSILRIGTWTLSHLFHGKPPSKLLQQIQPALPFVHNLLLMADEEVVVNACRTLSYLTHDGSSKMIQAVIDANVCPRLVELLQSLESNVAAPILVTLRNLTLGDEAQTQILIDNGVLPCLKLVLSSCDKIVLRHACSVISNITRGNISQIQAEFDIKQEVAQAIVNAADGTPQQIQFLASKGCIEALCDLLTCPDPTTMTSCLSGLYNILLAGETYKGDTVWVNVYAEKVDKCGGLEKIESLQCNDNNGVSTMAMDILGTYWPESGSEQD